MSGAIGGKRRGQPGGEKTDGAGQRRAAKGATDGTEKRRNTEESGEKRRETDEKCRGGNGKSGAGAAGALPLGGTREFMGRPLDVGGGNVYNCLCMNL